MAVNDFRFDVDEAWAKQNNELLRDSGRIRTSGLILAAVLIAAAVACVILIDSAGWSFILATALVILAIAMVAVAIVAPKKVGGAADLYARYPLVAGVIAEVNPRDIVLMALVNLRVDPTAPPKWGLALRTVTEIKGQRRKLGVKVPSVAVSGRRSAGSQGLWDEVSPMPVAWGTPDPEVITAARKAIPQDQWDTLEKGRRRLDEVKATKFNLLALDD